MSNQAGKGDKERVRDFQKFRENFDRIKRVPLGDSVSHEEVTHKADTQHKPTENEQSHK